MDIGCYYYFLFLYFIRFPGDFRGIPGKTSGISPGIPQYFSYSPIPGIENFPGISQRKYKILLINLNTKTWQFQL